MDYLTVREIAEKWNVSVRTVNYYLNAGRIPGAVRKTGEWLVPADAQRPSDRRKAAILEADAGKEIKEAKQSCGTEKAKKTGNIKTVQKGNEKGEKHLRSSKCYMPLISMACSGSYQEFEDSLEDKEEKGISRALRYYFRNEHEKAREISTKYKKSASPEIRLSALLTNAMATIQTGNAETVRQDLDEIANEERLASNPTWKLYCQMTDGLLSVFFHSESVDINNLYSRISDCPEGMRYYMIYACAHVFYIKREYERAKGMAESALIMAGNRFPIASIYLYIVLTMICLSLKQDEQAKKAFDAAWTIAYPEHYIHPFIEHHGMLQGEIERSLRRQYPEEYNEIIESVYRFSRGWMKIHNPVSTLQVTDALTTYEFSVAMLAAKGRSNKEIAKLLGISVNTVKSHMENIFTKLHISSRAEIDSFVNR